MASSAPFRVVRIDAFILLRLPRHELPITPTALDHWIRSLRARFSWWCSEDGSTHVFMSSAEFPPSVELGDSSTTTLRMVLGVPSEQLQAGAAALPFGFAALIDIARPCGDVSVVSGLT